MDLATGQITKIRRVKNYKVPEDGSGFIAYLKAPAFSFWSSSCVLGFFFCILYYYIIP